MRPTTLLFKITLGKSSTIRIDNNVFKLIAKSHKDIYYTPFKDSKDTKNNSSDLTQREEILDLVMFVMCILVSTVHMIDL